MKESKRPSWDEYFMDMAHMVCKRSTCLSRQVGAVIIKDKHPVSTGYSGPASGVTHCEDKGGCIRRQQPDYQSGKYLEICPSSHAEQNAIAFAARHGISTSGTTIYVTTFPCKDCMNSIVNSGIKRIVYADDYNSELSKRIAKEAGVELIDYNKLKK